MLRGFWIREGERTGEHVLGRVCCGTDLEVHDTRSRWTRAKDAARGVLAALRLGPSPIQSFKYLLHL